MNDTKIEKTDLEKVVPLEKEIKLSGEKYIVGAYSIREIIKFSRVFLDVAVVVQKKYPSLEFKAEDFSKFLPLMLDEVPKLIDLFAIAIGKEGEWLGNQKDLAGFSALFLAVCEVNDFGVIISNFQKGWKILKAQKITAM